MDQVDQQSGNRIDDEADAPMSFIVTKHEHLPMTVPRQTSLAQSGLSRLFSSLPLPIALDSRRFVSSTS